MCVFWRESACALAGIRYDDERRGGVVGTIGSGITSLGVP
jgi:hypothetical protein